MRSGGDRSDRWLPHKPPITGRVLLPGAFNPLHEGHRQLAQVAGRILGKPVALELSISNVDKTELSWAEVRRRIDQIAFQIPVLLTRVTAQFIEKAELFPDAVFVVGVDTAERLLTPRYYGSVADGVTKALELLRQHGCRFLVGGRMDARRRFVRLHDLPIPAECRDLFREIAPEVFRVDISSTELRCIP